MRSSEIASKVVPSGILSVDQIAKVFTYISSAPDRREFVAVDFPMQKREPKTTSPLITHLPPTSRTNNNNNARTSTNNRQQTRLVEYYIEDYSLLIPDDVDDEPPRRLGHTRGRRGWVLY
jgi:hypothetical protein